MHKAEYGGFEDPKHVEDQLAEAHQELKIVKVRRWQNKRNKLYYAEVEFTGRK